jgi:hypothetical protein
VRTRLSEILFGATVTLIVFSHWPVLAETELLSLGGITLGPNQYIDKFKIITWGGGGCFCLPHTTFLANYGR